MKNYSILVLGCVEPLGPVLNLRLSEELFRQNTTKGEGGKLIALLVCSPWPEQSWLRGRAVHIRNDFPGHLPEGNVGGKSRSGGRKAIGRKLSFSLRKAVGGQDMHVHALTGGKSLFYIRQERAGYSKL